MTLKIRIETWSGALGKPVGHKQIDAASLTPDKRHELEHLVVASRIAELPAAPPPTDQTRDDNLVKLVLDADGEERVARVAKSLASPELRKLIEFVEANGA